MKRDINPPVMIQALLSTRYVESVSLPACVYIE